MPMVIHVSPSLSQNTKILSLKLIPAQRQEIFWGCLYRLMHQSHVQIQFSAALQKLKMNLAML